MAGNIAADLRAILPSGRWDLLPTVESSPGSALATAPSTTPLLFSPRVWSALSPAGRADPRALEIRYLIEPKDLSSLGEELDWEPRPLLSSERPTPRRPRIAAGASLIVLGALALLPAAAAQQPDSSSRPPFERAQAAFMSHDFAAAESAYREVLASDTVPAHRRQAATEAAAIAWRVREDTATAQWVLSNAAGASWGRYDALIERARMLRVWGDYAGSREAATQARAAASTEAERDDATTSWADATLTPLLRDRLRRADAPRWGSGRPEKARADSASLREVVVRLDSIVQRSPGGLQAGRLLVLAGALSDDAPAVFDGWRSYYLVETGDTLHALLAASRRALRAAAASRAAGPAALAQRRAALAGALRNSRLFDAAAVVALARDNDGTTLASRDVRARETVVYAAFVDSVKALTDRYYRATALGKGNPKAWQAALDSAARRLWPRLLWSGPVPKFTEERFEAELDRRFGALINLGETAGYQDLHMGHRVLDDRRTVEQYGHTGRVRFVAIDAIVSNGFQSWAWDGQAQHGGWATKELIVQVRPAYAGEPMQAWWQTTEPETMRRLAEELAGDSVADLAKARRTPVAYFPSVEERLARDGRRLLLDSLRNSGLSGNELESSFKREYGRALTESSIFAHEGRHAIDNNLATKLTPEELEYRAKLSEVAFAPRPRLALGGIISANAGDETPHGKANQRVLEGLQVWMQQHELEIRQLDRSAPLLPQFPLLTDAQIKAAFAAQDPFAGRSGAARDSGVSAATEAPHSEADGQPRRPAESPPPELH
jgi:hypothetical protein